MSFDDWFGKNIDYLPYGEAIKLLCKSAWEHQQQSIDELTGFNLELQFQNNLFNKENELLQAKLNEAVEALEVYESIDGEESIATIALNQINKLKGE